MILDVALGIVLGVGFLIAIAGVLYLLLTLFNLGLLRYLFLIVASVFYLIIAIGMIVTGDEDMKGWGGWMIGIPIILFVMYKIKDSEEKLNQAKREKQAVYLANTLSQEKSKNHVFDDVIKVRCEECGHTGKPRIWLTRRIYGLILSLYLLLPGYGYFVSTNPYICSKCGSRRRLTSILANGEKVSVVSMRKWLFSTISISFILFLWLPVLALFFTLSHQELFTPEEQKTLPEVQANSDNKLTPQEREEMIAELEDLLKEKDRRLDAACKLKIGTLRSELYNQDISDVLEVFFSTKTKSCLFVFQELTYRDVPEFHRVSTSRKKQLIDFETRKVLEEHEDIGFNEDFFNDFNRKVDGYR